jgi:hypothetical protein
MLVYYYFNILFIIILMSYINFNVLCYASRLRLRWIYADYYFISCHVIVVLFN